MKTNTYRAKKLLLSLFATLLPALASAEKVEIDGIWYNLVSKAKQAEVTFKGDSYNFYDEYYGSIAIPAIVTYDGVEYSVTSIGERAFSICTNLTNVTIPKGVTSIGDEAFYQCSSLTTVTIPEGVANIGEHAFVYCSSLTTITIPKSVTSIGYRTFYGCSSLTSINIPEGVTTIGKDAFYGCSSLASITIPEGVTSIGEWAFNDCSSLTTVTIPESVTSIKNYTFYGCSGLNSITIPKSVTSIGDRAFYDCSSLESITIPEGVTSIGGYAFRNCSSLATIVLPGSIRYIYSEAFANCPELLDVYCYAESVYSTGKDAFNDSYTEYATLHVPVSALASYKTKAPWSSFGKFETLETSVLVANITLSQSSATLTEGETMSLTATVSPDEVTDKTITWSSSNTSVATVDNTGKVIAIAPGTATITATANDGSGVSASCEVTVEAMPTEVTITINQYGSATYCSPYALDFSNVERLKAYAAAGYNSITGVVTLLRLNTSQPGEGLFIKGEPGKYMVPVMESTGDHTTNMLVGTLAKTPLNKTSDDGQYRNFRYTTKTGVPTPMFYEIADGYTLSANKAYLQIPTAWLPAEAKSISLRFDEGEGTTDIDASTLNPQRSTEVYDLYGRRVNNPVKGGIYIVGGKKVVY